MGEPKFESVGLCQKIPIPSCVCHKNGQTELTEGVEKHNPLEESFADSDQFRKIAISEQD
jgi:hypothetical protein